MYVYLSFRFITIDYEHYLLSHHFYIDAIQIRRFSSDEIYKINIPETVFTCHQK